MLQVCIIRTMCTLFLVAIVILVYAAIPTRPLVPMISAEVPARPLTHDVLDASRFPAGGRSGWRGRVAVEGAPHSLDAPAARAAAASTDDSGAARLAESRLALRRHRLAGRWHLSMMFEDAGEGAGGACGSLGVRDSEDPLNPAHLTAAASVAPHAGRGSVRAGR